MRDRPAPRDLPVAILAGGKATRLGDIGKSIPKALVPVAGRPFLDHQLALLKREGVHRVVICAGHLGEQIRDHAGDGARYGLSLAYSFDGPKLLGTGGALRRALPLLGEVFFVLYGDSYLDLPLAPVVDAFVAAGKPALMTVFANHGRFDTSNVAFDGTHVRYDKRHPTPDMRYIDYGLGILTAPVLAGYGENEAFDLADVYAKLSAEGRLAGYEAKRRFYEIGTPASLAEADAYLRSRR
ncbi:MAG TPA: nucleotidyltransferase family protein [Bauldia sp.]|nr:nucleotidyltransferase family protein [Bauldia sp.]